MNQPHPFTTWRTSSRSSGGGNCVEVAITTGGMIGVRDSKNPSGAVLTFTAMQWQAFITGICGDDFPPHNRAL